MQRIGVTLLSGGMDSTVVSKYALSRTDDLTAVTFQYGQSHSREIQSAQKVAELMGIRHEVIDVSFFGKVAWYSALTSPEQFPVPRERDESQMGFSIPITYVPLRNTFFLSLATAYLESHVLHFIEVDGVSPGEIRTYVFMAANAIDYSGYPDCRPEYFQQVAVTLRDGSKMCTEYKVALNIETPIIHLSKAEIVQMGVRLGAPLEHTWSCYEGGEAPCGTCDSCLLRAKGFQEAGVEDPLLTRLGKT